MNHPIVIGLTGGIACGKSTVAKMLSQLGADVLDADRIGHDVLQEEDVKRQIVNQWGKQVIRNHRVSRRDLAEIVFDPETGAEQLEKLEAITHPRIRQIILQRIAELRDNGSVAVVLDAPLLHEAGWDEMCDKVLFVACAENIRIHRALQRGWTLEEFRMREASQMEIDEKRKRATDVVDNSGSLEKTENEIRGLWLQWGLTVASH